MATKEQGQRDEARTHWLDANGCRVWNKHVFMYPDRVVDTTCGELTAPLPSGIAAPFAQLTSHLPPQAGKGNDG